MQPSKDKEYHIPALSTILKNLTAPKSLFFFIAFI
jgi:hypothetical protein